MLGPRLQAVASFIRQGDRVADVGTDHGYLPVWLVLSGVSPSAIASDINEMPLQRARDTAARYGAENISFRLCAGLAGVAPGEADACVIAGMSGENMMGILSAANWDWRGKRLVLQPMTKRHELLEWLYRQGFHLAGERFAAEKGGLYRIFCVEWGPAPLPRPAHLWGGLTETDYAHRQAARLRRAVAGLKRAEAPDTEKIAAYMAVLEDMKDAYGW